MTRQIDNYHPLTRLYDYMTKHLDNGHPRSDYMTRQLDNCRPGYDYMTIQLDNYLLLTGLYDKTN